MKLHGRYDSISGQSVDIKLKDSATGKRDLEERRELKRQLNEDRMRRNEEKRQLVEEARVARAAAKEKRMLEEIENEEYERMLKESEEKEKKALDLDKSPLVRDMTKKGKG